MSNSPLLKKSNDKKYECDRRSTSMDGGDNGRTLGHTAASRYFRPPGGPVPVHNSETRRSPTNQTNIITLDQIRTGPRTQNDYVENPTATPVPLLPPRLPAQVSPNILNAVVPRPERQTLLPEQRSVPAQPIFRQPTSTGLKLPNTTAPTEGDTKENDKEAADPHKHNAADSIFCNRCGECKCSQCTAYRELPSRWICNKKVECSATKIVDYCSCLCCIRAAFYHCNSCKDSDGEDISDDPCACCARPKCCERWTSMGILSLCLPCLCFYWPLRCGVKACTAGYNQCTRRGCHCRRDVKVPSQNMTKRLLPIDSESSSA